MFSDKTFQVILLISVLAHGAILIQHSSFTTPSLNKPAQKVEIRYLEAPWDNKVSPKTSPVRKEPLLRLSLPVGLNKNFPPPFLNKKEILERNKGAMHRELAFVKPVFNKPDVIAIKKKISLPPVDLEKINNPSYISYYQLVREKIKRAAYQNYTSSEVGEVYLSFIVSDDGYLQEVRLAEEKSSSSSYLKEIALQSIKSASPFPNFPKELDYPQLSFNVIISFEVE
ncbi:energy transducer TonB [bacterium]|nr:MAG: energy transducer TonB [bacterium]